MITSEKRRFQLNMAVGYLVLLLLCTVQIAASDCTKTSTGLVPLNDLREGLYKGKQGGLYSGGANTRPLAHELAGLEQARNVRPLDAMGQPSDKGRIVLLSIGMSNTTQEFSTFKPLADADPDKNPTLVIVDGAQGGMTASIISNLNSANGQLFWNTVDSRLRSSGVTAAQVQVVWFKEADAQPNAAFPNDALILKSEFAEIARILKSRFPNLRLEYCSSRIYGGYASTALNPEPYAYQSGFAVKWLIEDQINGAPDLNYDPARGPVRAPWLAWGPYLWADGLTARSDGLSYVCSDFADDGTHPAAGGARNKVARLLLDFLKSDITSRTWFLNARSASRSWLAIPTMNAVAGSESAGANPMAAGIALANLSTAEAALTFTATGSDGMPLKGASLSNPKFTVLAAGAQLALMDEQIFGPAIRDFRTPVWMRLEGNLDNLAGFFLLFRAPSLMGGAPLIGRPASLCIFPEISQRGIMQLYITNRNAIPTAVSLQLMRADGTLRAAAAGQTLRAGTVLPINFAELFPAEPLVESDYLRVSAGQGVDTLELFGKKDFYMAALSGQDTSAGASLLYCPQYATGGSWQTQLSIINLDAVPGAVTLEFFNDAGILQGQARILPIAPQGKLWISDPNFFVSSGGSLVQGYVKINGSGLKLTGSVLFADPQLESFAAALPLLAQFEPSAVLSQVASGKSWFTGVALLNAGDTAANLNLEVFDTQGAKVAGRQEILGPRQRGSQLLTQFFPELENRELSSGYVKIVSDRPIGLFAVYGTRDLSTLSAIPAQPIRF